ncbi:hypothetical protein F5878DRAFT_393200 [Lentinula raphanica]|uniref:Uncharacterized protein n=1 Tax=Lentinula raphanica TaxID=153919 RepID=A0AA38U8V1_9AGAR|nr:hypothetical protein F5878DRAFT_393200 [Lentinula raphanica]
MRLQRICHGTKIALLGFLTVFCNVAALPMDAHYPSSTSLGVSQLYDSEMHPRALHIEPNGWTVNIQFKGSPKYGRRNEDTANVILILQNMAQALQPYLPPGTLFYLPSQGYIPFWNADSQIKFDYYVYKELPPTSVPKSEDHKAGSGTIQKSDLQTTIIAEQGASYDEASYKYTTTVEFLTPTPLVYADNALGIYLRIITAMKERGLRRDTLVYFPAQGLVPSWNNDEIKFNLYFHYAKPLPLKDLRVTASLHCGGGVVKKKSAFDIETMINIVLPEEPSEGKGREEEHNVTPAVMSGPSQDRAESSQPTRKGKKTVRFSNDPPEFPLVSSHDNQGNQDGK